MTSPLLNPTPEDIHVFPTAADFRAWLEANHDTAAELWVGYYKKGVPKQSMTYARGGRGGAVLRLDRRADASDRRRDHANRFTPRRKGSNWSAINIAKMAELKAAGRLHPAGLRAFEARDRRKDAIYSYERPPAEMAPEMLARLQADAASAWAFWEAERPSFRKQIAWWVTSGKRPETNERRFAELLETARAGTRPKAFIVERQDR